MTDQMKKNDERSTAVITTEKINDFAKKLKIELPHDKMSPEEFKDFLSKKNLHLILHQSITDSQKPAVARLVEELEKIKNEVAEKKDYLNKNINIINDQVDTLTKSKIIKINIEEREQSKKNVAHYSTLLDHIDLEVTEHLSFFSNLLSDTPPTDFFISPYESDSFDSFLYFKIKSCNKYIKETRKSITVSFSRYKFSFEEQLKQLELMKNYVEKSKDSK